MEETAVWTGDASDKEEDSKSGLELQRAGFRVKIGLVSPKV